MSRRVDHGGRIDAVLECESETRDVNSEVERSNKEELNVKGEMRLFVEYLGEKHLTRFIVVAGGYELLSGKGARRLEILDFDRKDMSN